MSIPNPYASAGVVIPTTTTTTCIPNYVSITLQQGNSLILPPGATIVSVSDITKIQSDCADLTNLEQPECYIIPVIATDAHNTENTNAWENGSTTMQGISVGGIFYGFSGIGLGDGGNFFSGQVVSQVTSTPVLNGLLTNVSGNDQGDTERGGVMTLCFNVIPSLVSSIYIQVSTGVPKPGNPIATARFYAQPCSSYAGKWGSCS